MRSVLVVDDSPIELLMTKALLDRLGFEARTAGSGEEALELMRACPPDAVISDITMPGMSGLELLKASRNMEPPPVFIMATGLDDAGHAVESLNSGAYGYLTKPLKEESLRKALEDASLSLKRELEAKHERERITRSDPLTGLANRDEFLRNLSAYAAEVPLSIFFINIDGLSYVNNTFGHADGDSVLQHVAEVLKQSVRPGDIVARYGGDVFAVALAGLDGDNADAKAQAISRNVEQARVLLGGREHSLTVTVGIASGNARDENLVNNADLALFLAKEKGRNQIYFYRDEDEAHRKKFGALFNNLETLKLALQEGRFSMNYQPIVHLRTGKAHHYEALIRIRDEAGNVLPPDVFIRVAEKFDLATRIDCMVVKACISKLAELPGDGPGLAINLSGKSVGNAELLDLIRRELSATGVDPGRIIFEITETAAFHNLDLVQQFVREAKQLGCRFALDDFGVGFSSFYYIKQLDIDYLKIDGSFIRNLLESANDRVFVQAMVEICRVYDMKVVAEWVENEEITDLLKEMGVDYGQGYHFGRPMPDCPASPAADNVIDSGR